MMKDASPPDYYEILQVHRRAEQEIIERAYRILAKKYHPDNDHTGDAKTFQMLIEAYRVLSDPKERAAYDDNQKSADVCQNGFLPNGFKSESAKEERRTHQAILLMLYFARRQNPTKAGVGIVDLEKLLDVQERDLEFHIWYLKEKGWIQRDESGGFCITASGVDEIIEDDLLLKKDYLLPYFNEASLKDTE